MTYLYVYYPYYKKYMIFASISAFLFLYNYNIFFHNKNMQFVTKCTLGLLFGTSNVLYYRYRKQVLRCNLFDEYVQMRADELVKEREHLLRGEDMKRWVWNDASDFADSELLLQDFVRRYSDDTLEKPLTIGNARIGV